MNVARLPTTVAAIGCAVILLAGWKRPNPPRPPSLLDDAKQPAKAAKARMVATVEGITEYQLPNGLRFLLFPDQSKEQITVNITYLVGSRHEGYGETGMAHLLEHLVFKGLHQPPQH